MTRGGLKRLASGAAGAACVAGGWILVATLYTPARAEAGGIHPQPIVHEVYDPEAIDRNIAFHEGRVRRDPDGAIGVKMLGAAYLARSRESDVDAFAWKAEDAARRSLALRTNINESAEALLVQSLLEQHRFQDALSETERGLKRYPEEHGLMKLRADVLIEVGRYAEAETLLKRLPFLADDVQRTAVEAHILSLQGRHPAAIAKLEGAYTTVLGKREVANATLGWYRTKIATEYEGLGQTERAGTEFARALELSPRSYKALLGLARVAAKRRDWAGSLAWADRTLTVANSLDAVAMRGDAHLALGRKAEARADYAAVRTMYEEEVARFGELKKGGPLAVRPIDRQFASFAVSHRMFAREALPAAERDLRNRPDATAKSNVAALRALLARAGF